MTTPTNTAEHHLVEQVRSCIAEHNLCQPSETLYVALSGGSDSVALLRVLHSLGYDTRALHANFGLRGAESDADTAFVEALCRELGIPLEVRHFDTQGYAECMGVSIEMAARELRYDWFADVYRAHGHKIAIAHNSQDNVETLILNLCRGTGIRGLSGMPYKRTDGIIRPLMTSSPDDVRSYLETLEQGWCEDHSNQDEQYTRNYIRHSILPALGRINPQATNNILRTIAHLSEVEHYYLRGISASLERIYSEGYISVSRLLEEPHRATLLYELLRPYGFGSAEVHQIAESLPKLSSGASFVSPSHRLVRSFDRLELLPLTSAETNGSIAVDPRQSERIELPEGILELRLRPHAELTSLRLPADQAVFDWEMLISGGTTELLLRRPQTGDRLKPHGLSGSKLISRIFIDRKVSHSRRIASWVLTHCGQSLWLLGIQSSRLYAITDQTQTVLHLRYHPVEPTAPLGDSPQRATKP